MSCGVVSGLVVHGLVIAFIALPQNTLSRGVIGEIARPSLANPDGLAKVKTPLNNPRFRNEPSKQATNGFELQAGWCIVGAAGPSMALL